MVRCVGDVGERSVNYWNEGHLGDMTNDMNFQWFLIKEEWMWDEKNVKTLPCTPKKKSSVIIKKLTFSPSEQFLYSP